MSHHVLVLGGHGKVAQLLTPLLLQRSWTVTSVIRAQEQVPTIEKLGAGQPGKLNVLTFKIDRDAAVHFINAAAATPSVTRFLLVSYIGSRRAGASWWPEGEWEQYNESVNHGVLANYYKAKIVADEELYRASRRNPHLVGINLRPGLLTDDPVGKVADTLLAAEGIKNTWLDLYDGDEEIEDAVKRVVQAGINVAEGEPVYSE
uniref:Uncharacterized protein n=1 Tax=Bionectria ochroleuca TaxID=29856 RepID=A0A0B7K1D1_BIOOC